MLRGWKEICKYSGGHSKVTLKKWMKKHGYPVFYIEGKAMASTAAIEAWAAEKVKRPKTIQNLANNFTKMIPR